MSVTVSKNNDFNAVFTVRFNNERYMCWYELHPSHIITVATVPCESQNTEKYNTAKYNITVGYYQRKLHRMYRITSSKWTADYKIWGVMQQCVYETKICDIHNPQKRLMQTWFDFEQNVTEAATVKRRNHLRSCVCWWRTL